MNLWHARVREAAEAAAKFVAEMEVGLPGRWLTLLGDAGAGKTALARQAFDQAKRLNPGDPGSNPIWPPDWAECKTAVHSNRRPYCLWFEMRKFADRMHAGDWNLPEDCADDWCVAMDDLGAGRNGGDFLAEAMYRLAQRRLGRWTLWTSNLTLGEIADKIDPRLASRMVRDDNVVITLDCGDYALRT